MNETLSHQKFRSRIDYLSLHLELCDAGLRLISEATKKADQKKSITKILGIDCEKYKKIDHPASQAKRLINHTRSKNNESAIVDIFEAFTEYLTGILGEMFSHDPLLVVGKAPSNQSFQFHQIVGFGTWESVCDEMVKSVFRSMENEKSTKKLLERILDKTGIQIDENLKKNALAYLEIRHLIIHQGAKADAAFKSNFGDIIAIDEHGNLPTDFKTVENGILHIQNLVDELDIKMIAAGLAKKR